MTSNALSEVGESTGLLSRLWSGWAAFWFTPADPTLLGLIRIFAGLVVLYVHLAYTVDLQELFGEHAWLDLATVNQFRYDNPYRARPFDWSDSDPYARPQEPERGLALTELTPEELEYAKAYHINPRLLHARGFPAWSVWFEVTDPTGMAVVHGLILLNIFCFMIGFCTPITSVLTWVSAISYIQRAP